MKWRKGWERQTEWWKKQGLKNKILLICIPGAIFSSVIIMVLASFIFREYEKNMYNITIQNLNMIIRHIEMELQEADDTSVEIITDATVQSALSPGKPNVRSWEVSMDYIRQLRALYEVLQDQLRISRNIVSISIFVDDEWYYVGSSRRSYNRSRLEEMRKSLAENSSEITWYVKGYPANRIYGLRSIRDLRYHTFEDLALLVIEYDLEGSIEGLLKNNSNVRYSPGLAVMDGEKLLYSDIAALPSRELVQRGNRDYRSVTLNGKKYFASWLDGTDYGWSYVFLILYDDLFGMMRFLKVVFWGVVAAVVGLSVFYCEKLTGLITRRFTYLTGRMKSVQEGDFRAESRRGKGQQDELEQVCDRFEDMVGHVDRLIQDNYVKQMLIRENQLKVLQNQINPHFLFNTLNMISCTAKLEKAGTTEKMIASLSSLFRYNLKMSEQVVFLEQELKIVDDYIYIQKMRFGGRIRYERDLPEDIRDIQIPSFTLQPLVENAVVHGISKKETGGRIHLRVWRQDGDVRITVADTGAGMTEEQLTDIRNAVKERRTSKIGIGLGNIYKRVHILYEHGDVQIYSKKDRGTVILMKIPQKLQKS